MTDATINPGQQAQAEPQLRQTAAEPRGVLHKNLKPALYLGAAGVVILAALFSGVTKKSPAHQAEASHEPPQPAVQDNTDNNVQELKNQVAAARARDAQQAAMNGGQDPALANATLAQRYSATGEPAPCVPGQPCASQGGYGQAQGGQQLTPAQQEALQLAAKERELAFNARFASNLVFARPPEVQAKQADPADTESDVAATSQQIATPAPNQPGTSLMSGRAAGDAPGPASGLATTTRRPQINIDSAVGQPYVIYEGLTLDTVLMNRLDGDAVGPVKVLVSNPVYSHDRQHVLIPDGTVVLGEARKIGAASFGQQRRMAVAFHRMIMPDGYAVDLDQFHGLDQIGEEALKDKVNNHYIQVFGTSIALGVLSGAGQITQGGGLISASGSQSFATSAAGSVSQSAASILNRFIQIPPTITIREGHRVKVYFTQDMLLPAYENHTIPQTF